MWEQCPVHEKHGRFHSPLQYAFQSVFYCGVLTSVIFPNLRFLFLSFKEFITSPACNHNKIKIEIKENMEESQFTVFTCNSNASNVSLLLHLVSIKTACYQVKLYRVFNIQCIKICVRALCSIPHVILNLKFIHARKDVPLLKQPTDVLRDKFSQSTTR